MSLKFETLFWQLHDLLKNQKLKNIFFLKNRNFNN